MSQARSRGGPSGLSPWLVVITFAVLAGGITYLFASVRGADTTAEAVVGLSANVPTSFFAQERELIIERAREARLDQAVESDVRIQIEKANSDATRVLVTATGPHPSANVTEADRAAVEMVTLSDAAAEQTLADELARLMQLEEAQAAERNRVQDDLREALAASETDGSPSADVVQLDQQLRDLESRLSEIRTERAEQESAGARSSAILVSQAREPATPPGNPWRAAFLGAVVGALGGFLLVAATRPGRKTAPFPSAPKELGTANTASSHQPKKRFSDPSEVFDPSAVTTPTAESPGDESLAGTSEDLSLTAEIFRRHFAESEELPLQPVTPPSEDVTGGASRYGMEPNGHSDKADEPPTGRYGVDRTSVSEPVKDDVVTDWPTFDSTLSSRAADQEPPKVSTSSEPTIILETVEPLELEPLKPLEPLDLDTSRIRHLLEKANASLSNE